MKRKKGLKFYVSDPSMGFSFEADPLLNLSLEEVESLPVELQEKLRRLKKEEDLLIMVNEFYASFLQKVTKIDRDIQAIVKKRDGVRKGILKFRDRCLGAKEEEVEEIGNMLLHLNSEFMSVQENIINLNAEFDEVLKKRITLLKEGSKRKAKHLNRKEEFMMQVVVGEQHAKD